MSAAEVITVIIGLISLITAVLSMITAFLILQAAGIFRGKM